MVSVLIIGAAIAALLTVSVLHAASNQRTVPKHDPCQVKADFVAEVFDLIAENPDWPFFHELKGDLLSRSGKAREAIPVVRQALKLAADGNLIRVQLATALLATEDQAVVNEAAELLRRSLIEDQNARAYRELANALIRQGKRPEADAAIAHAYFLEGDVKEAQIFAKRAQSALAKGSPAWVKMDDIANFKPET